MTQSRRRLLNVIIFAVILMSTGPLLAGSQVTAKRLTTDATMLLPETLRKMVTIYWKDVARSIAAHDSSKHNYSEHYYWHGPKQGGLAPKVIAEDACRSVKMIRKKQSFSQVFFLFGKIAFLISESFNPLNTANYDPKEIYYYSAFEQFVEDSSPQFRIRFRGYHLVPIEKQALQLDIQRRLRKIGNLYDPLSEEYNKKIQTGQPFIFGYQSLPFGIAMISYSTAVNAVVDIWCSIWKSAGGELENPPFDIPP